MAQRRHERSLPRRGPYPNTTQVLRQTLASYENYVEGYLRKWGRRRYRRPPLLVEWMKQLSPRARVLDLGCGPGQDSTYLHRQGIRSVGLDLTRSFLQFARCRSPRLPLVHADIRNLPFRDGTFDGIWAAASLIHLEKREVHRMLCELLEQIRPGGMLAATFAYGAQSGMLTRGWIPGRYFSRWRKGELDRIVRQAGWDILTLSVVANRERKGRWLNLLVRRPLT